MHTPTNPIPSIGLPGYEAELLANQRDALRRATVATAGMLLVFTLFDLFHAPQAWALLFGLRLAAAGSMLLIGQVVQRKGSPVFALLFIGLAILSATQEASVLLTGGAQGPYLIFFLAVIGGVGVMVPMRQRQAIAVQAAALSIALLPLCFALRRTDWLPLATQGSLLVCVSIAAVVGARTQDALRRREHRARAEAARLIGLVNLGTLAGGLAHELAGPLTFVNLELDQLAQDLAGNPEALGKISAARAGLSRMTGTLTAMRKGARFSNGEARKVRLCDEVDLALALFAHRLRGQVKIERDFAPDAPAISCQPTLLGQVLVNLIVNALDALAQQEERRLFVRVRAGVVEVEDNGPGVPEHLRGRVFEPFFSTKGEDGNGLGLWISSEIARVHGGKLEAESGGSGGALFRLTLPVSPA